MPDPTPHGPALPDPGQPAGTDRLPRIRHIVVLMMENHSYDNYLGTLAGRGDGLAPGPDGAPEAANPGLDGAPVTVHHARGPVQEHYSPTQSWHASHLQFDGGRCDGFVRSVEITQPKGDATEPMTYWTAADLPFYHGLARTFPVADRWFCSCLGPTFPNRRFLIAGTAHGLIDDLPFCMVDYPPAGTIFDLLDRFGISWVNYHNVTPVKILLTRLLGKPGLIALRRLGSVARWLPPVVNAVKGNKSFTADLYPLGLLSCLRHLRTARHFFKDADNGTLPAFSIVDPDFGNFSEENPQDVRKGESFASEVIRRVMRGKGWPHPPHLAVRRARRLLRPRAAAPGAAAGRHRRTQRPVHAGLAPVLPAAVLRHLHLRDRGHRRRPAGLRPPRLPGAGSDRLALRQARPCVQRGARSHLRAPAGRGEVEPAPADSPGRRGDDAAWRPGPRRPARVPRPPGPARPQPDLGYLVTAW
jgi:hypothetical protein